MLYPVCWCGQPASRPMPGAMVPSHSTWPLPSPATASQGYTPLPQSVWPWSQPTNTSSMADWQTLSKICVSMLLARLISYLMILSNNWID